MANKEPKQTESKANTKGSNNDEDFNLIDSAHFLSMQVKLEIFNTTANTTVVADPATRIIEMQDHKLLLEMPSKSCAQGHSLIVGFKVSRHPITVDDPPDLEFQATAKVDNQESSGGGVDRVNVSLVQLNEKVWKEFCGGFADRQKEIELFLKAARGY